MSQFLHPSGFIESASECNLQRIRSQPNRESAGVTLEECQQKYQKHFELPLENIQGYLRQLQTSWDRLSPQDKLLVTQNILHNLPQLQNQIQSKENFDNNTKHNPANSHPLHYEVNQFISDYILLSPKDHTVETLNMLYYPDPTIVTPNQSNQIRDGFKEFNNDQSISYCFTDKMVLLFVLLLVVFLGVGFVIGWGAQSNSKSK